MRRFAPLLVFCLTLALYTATASPDLAPGHDSGELCAAASTLGIAHPPSYPLYTLLGHLVTLVPGATAAYKLNLWASLCCALAAGLACHAWRRWGTGPAVTASLLYAVALTPWRQAVGAEKYSLHLALLAALWALLSDWCELSPASRSGRLRWVALCAGLGMAHHHTFLLSLPAVAWLLWSYRPASWKGVLWSGAGLLPYLYTFVRAGQHPLINWGDPSTPERFFAVLLRSGYGSVALNRHAAAGSAGVQLGHYFYSLAWAQFPVTALVALGAWGRGPYARFFAINWLLFGPVFACIASQPAESGYFDLLERFYAASYLAFAGLIAAGASRGPRAWPVLLVAVVATGMGHFRGASLAGQYHVRDGMEAILDRAPASAVYFACSDLSAGSALYLQAVEGRRGDLQLVFPGLLNSAWYRKTVSLPEGSLAEVFAGLRARGKEVYVDAVLRSVPGFFVPHGLAYRYLAPGEPIPDRVETERANFDYLESRARRGDYSLGDRPFWVDDLIQRWRQAYRTTAESLVQADPERARRALERVRQMGGSGDGR